ncbi:hypothetical protein [Acetivibrio cellulolyticus]|uniref:hypothetical protein n=1 Tax=Acetivibrio cellulolyticus TaxID=35830 RepID=UPI0001E2FC0B|nr:hypothetical protein [Acetivibrio cellulolyticus]
MDKKTLIQYVEELASKTDIKDCISDNDGKDSLGKSQFRSIAELCAKADFYEEIKLLIEYKESKGNGWDKNIAKPGMALSLDPEGYYFWDKNIAKSGFITCGEVIVRYMENIKKQSSEVDVLKNLELFFGYMHWKANVLCKENKKGNEKSKGKGEYR